MVGWFMGLSMRFILSLLFLGAIIAVWLYDAVASVRGHGELSASAVILEWSIRWPLIPLLVGVLLGHIFWPQR